MSGLTIPQQAILLSLVIAFADDNLYKKDVDPLDYQSLFKQSGLSNVSLPEDIWYDIPKIEKFLYTLNTNKE